MQVLYWAPICRLRVSLVHNPHVVQSKAQELPHHQVPHQPQEVHQGQIAQQQLHSCKAEGQLLA